MIEKSNSKMSVIVQSCDKYSDIWPLFYTLLDRYWSDCPYPVFHVTESQSCGYHNILDILTGNLEWSDRLLFALRETTTDYILLLLEDYLLLRKVDNEKMYNCIQILENHPTVAAIRIFPVMVPDKKFQEYSDVNFIPKSHSYSVSTQATIWRKEMLMEILKENETVWEFELKGSQRAQNMPYDFLGLRPNHSKKAEEGDYPYTYLCTAVYKGKWMRETIEFCKKEGLSLDLDYRKVETHFEQFYRKYYHSLPLLFQHILDYIRKQTIKVL